MKIVLYDFCDTLVNFQTADAYTDFVAGSFAKKNIEWRDRFYRYIVRFHAISAFLEKYGFLNKRLKLWRLKGLPRETLGILAKKFYEERIVPNLHMPLIRELEEYQRNGYHIYVVSGGYDLYLRLFVEQYKLDGLISTKLEFKRNDIFSGHIWMKDCMGKEKVKLLNAYFAGKNIDFSISYSDSISDLPMLQWAREGVVVSKWNHRKWPKTYGLRQIVLNDGDK